MRKAERTEGITILLRKGRRTIRLEALSVGIRHLRGEIKSSNADFEGITIPTGF
jgi:hypothetical protein